jgi:Spy/CpxP family protein refolding chaperone
MNKVLGLVLAGVVALGVASYAGDGCCAAGKAKAGGASEMFGKLSLTADQKAKLTALQDECMKGKCTETAHEKFTKGVKEILTPEQYAQWKSDCDKAAKGGTCPYMKSAAAKSGDKS